MDSVRHHHARAFLGGKLATSLDEVPEGRRGALEGALRVSAGFGYVRQVGDVAG
jgi:hypothetical protein